MTKPSDTLTTHEILDMIQSLLRHAGDLEGCANSTKYELGGNHCVIADPAGLQKTATSLRGAAQDLALLIPDQPVVPPETDLGNEDGPDEP